MEELENIYKQTNSKMDKSIDSFVRELKGIRTGKASLSILDNVIVECYGSKMPINQVATLSIQDHKTINIEPWDKANLKDIERGIINSEIDVSPMNDGSIIRLSFPPLTEERRLEIVKLVKHKTEQSKISIRNLRREANDEVKSVEEEGHIGKDIAKTAHDKIQDITTNFVNKLIKITENKEKDIMQI